MCMYIYIYVYDVYILYILYIYIYIYMYRIIYVIMKAMCSLGCYHSGFVATRNLGHSTYGFFYTIIFCVFFCFNRCIYSFHSFICIFPFLCFIIFLIACFFAVVDFSVLYFLNFFMCLFIVVLI